MKALAYYIIVLGLLALSFGVQEFVPVLGFAQNAQILLPPALFFCSALSVSFPMMLVLALATGLVWDARHLPPRPETTRMAEIHELVGNMGTMGSRSEASRSLPLGYSAVLFGMLGMLVQGLRPMFKRGRWELPVIMVGVAMLAWLLIEYLLISFLRGSFYFPSKLWMKMTTCALLGMLVAPLLLFALHSLARILRIEQHQEGLTSREYGR